MPAELAALSPAERHRLIAERFRTTVAGTTDWGAPTPVYGWTARDVVAHLVDWSTDFLAAGAVELPPGPGVADDPAGAWKAHADSIQALLDDPESATAPFTHPAVGTHPLDEAVDRFYTADVFMHRWDLARASGQDDELDAAYCDYLLTGMEPMADVLRSSGHYGPPHATGADADATARLMAFIGRNPDWCPA